MTSQERTRRNGTKSGKVLRTKMFIFLPSWTTLAPIDKDCQLRYDESMPTQNVNLTRELDRFVKKAVKSGAFNNASEVHRAALAAMAKEEEERDLRLQRLKAEIQLGLDSGAPREISDIDAFLDGCATEARKELREKQ